MHSAKYSITEVDNLFLVKNTSLASRHKLSIVKVGEENLATCNCGRMASMGLMCRHAMAVLHQQKEITIAELAARCIDDAKRRWYGSELAASLNVANLPNRTTQFVDAPAPAPRPARIERTAGVALDSEHVPESMKMVLIQLRNTFERCATHARKQRATAVTALEQMRRLEMQLGECNKQQVAANDADCSSSDANAMQVDQSLEQTSSLSMQIDLSTETSSSLNASVMRDPPKQRDRKNPRTNKTNDDKASKRSKAATKRANLQNTLSELSQNSQPIHIDCSKD
jgi:hypothetical protein